MSNCWIDPKLLARVYHDRRQYERVFKVSQDEPRGDWESVFKRVKQGELSPKEIRRITPLTPEEKNRLKEQGRQLPPEIDPDWVEDVIHRRGFPRSWEEMRVRLISEETTRIRAMVDNALRSVPKGQHSQPSAIVDQVLEHFRWRIIVRCGVLLAWDKEGTRWKIDQWANDALSRDVMRYANPDKLFVDYQFLETLAQGWNAFSQTLTISASPGALTRDAIEAKRITFVKNKLDLDATAEPTRAEIDETCAYPTSFLKLVEILFDEHQVPNLHASIKYHAKEVLEYYERENKACGQALPDFDEVVSEFLLSKAFRIAKMAHEYLDPDDRKSRDPDSWAPCVFNSFEKDAPRAVDFAMNRKTNWREAFPTIPLSTIEWKEPLSREIDPADVPLDDDDIRTIEHQDEKRVEADRKAEEAQERLRRDKGRWVRKVLRAATADMLAVLPLVSDKTIDREEFAKLQGWEIAKVDELCLAVEQLFRDFVQRHGNPPGKS